MTPSEEKIYEAVREIAITQATFNANFTTLKEVVKEHDGHIETLKSDRNKVIGMSWIGGSILAIGTAIWEFFKH